MFHYCLGNAFNMNSVFSIPQNITTVGTYFAFYMFYQCSGTAFQVNSIFKFPLLSSIEVNKSFVFYQTFYNLGATPVKTRTAASIINGNPTPNTNKETFTGSGCFADRAYIPVEWGGDGLVPPEEFKFEVTTTAAK